MSYFSLDEFECNCGCGSNEVKQTLVHKLDTARGFASTPFIITSGYRCKDHEESKKNPKSSHILGLAADIAATNARDRFHIVDGLLQSGFNRIGVSKSFIHADIDLAKPANVMWTYD